MSGCGLVVHVLYVPDQNFSAIMVTWSEFIKGDGGGLFCGYEVSKKIDIPLLVSFLFEMALNYS